MSTCLGTHGPTQNPSLERARKARRSVQGVDGAGMLEQFIRGRGFDAFLPGLRSRFRANRMKFDYEYSPVDRSNASLHAILKNSRGCAQVSIWENGLADVTLVDTRREKEPIVLHFDSATEETFHALLARSFRYLRDGLDSLPE